MSGSSSWLRCFTTAETPADIALTTVFIRRGETMGQWSDGSAAGITVLLWSARCG